MLCSASFSASFDIALQCQEHSGVGTTAIDVLAEHQICQGEMHQAQCSMTLSVYISTQKATLAQQASTASDTLGVALDQTVCASHLRTQLYKPH